MTCLKDMTIRGLRILESQKTKVWTFYPNITDPKNHPVKYTYIEKQLQSPTLFGGF